MMGEPSMVVVETQGPASARLGVSGGEDAGLGGLGAQDTRLGADESRLGALTRGEGTFHRTLTDRGTVGGDGLFPGGKPLHRADVVESLLLVVPTLLCVIERLLVDVSGVLLAVD